MNEQEKKLIEQLGQLPKVKDQQNKALLFEQINQKVKGETMMRKRKRVNWVVPSIATVAVVVLAFIMIQSGLFKQNYSADQSTDLEIRTSEIGEVSDDSSELSAFEIEQTEDDDYEAMDSADFDYTVLGNRLVYYNDEYNLPIYTIGVQDLQAMYVIPISLVDTAATGIGYPNDVYNRISTFVDEDEFGVYEYPFDEIEFIFSEDLHEITMRVADDFVFPDSSTQMASFINIVNFMFADYPATVLNLETETKDYIELGQIGTMESLELEPVKNLAYKIYQYEDKERLLIPIQQRISGESFFTIDEALLEMQYDQPDFNVTASIPADVEYTVNPSDEDVVRITFEPNAKFGDNRETKEMIEAILMTAKSFGFIYVELHLDDHVTQVSQFDLTAPIRVPDAVNPILLH